MTSFFIFLFAVWSLDSSSIIYFLFSLLQLSSFRFRRKDEAEVGSGTYIYIYTYIYPYTLWAASKGMGAGGGGRGGRGGTAIDESSLVLVSAYVNVFCLYCLFGLIRLFVALPPGHDMCLIFIFFRIISIFSSFFFRFLKVSGLPACVCCAFRVQYVDKLLRCLLSLLDYNAPVVSLF